MYEVHMRATVSIDDSLLEATKRRAAREGLSLSAFVREALRRVLREPAGRPDASEPFEVLTWGGTGTRPGVDLRRLADVEDEEDRHLVSSDR